MAKEKYDDYLKFIDEALELAKSIPRYFSKFSNKIYCNHQKLAMYVLMQKLRLTTRGIISWLKSNKDALLHLGLNRIPVHTTIVRFIAKISKLIVYNLDRKLNYISLLIRGLHQSLRVWQMVKVSIDIFLQQGLV